MQSCRTSRLCARPCIYGYNSEEPTFNYSPGYVATPVEQDAGTLGIKVTPTNADDSVGGGLLQGQLNGLEGNPGRDSAYVRDLVADMRSARAPRFVGGRLPTTGWSCIRRPRTFRVAGAGVRRGAPGEAGANKAMPCTSWLMLSCACAGRPLRCQIGPGGCNVCGC